MCSRSGWMRAMRAMSSGWSPPRANVSAGSTFSMPMPVFRAGLAGIFDSTVELWTEVLRVNLIGPSLAIKHAAPEDRRARRRRDPVHGQRGGTALGRRRAGLFGNQGGGDQPRPDRGAAALDFQRAGQRDLPRADRDGNDRARLRICARNGQGGQARPAQSASPRGRTRGDRAGGAVPRLATKRVTSTARHGWSTAGYRRAIR